MFAYDGRFARRFDSRVPGALVALLLFAAIAAPSFAFTPRPCPGHLLLKLRHGVEARAAIGKPGQSATTGMPSLDRLNATFRVHAFAAQFPGETHASKASGGHDLADYFVLEFPPSTDLEAIRRAYAADPSVEVA